MESISLSVTFDTNTLENVLDLEREQAQDFRDDYLQIRQAIEKGQIRGFFSDTWITLEGIERKNRPEILGSRHLVASSTSSDSSTDSILINLTIGTKMERNHLHAVHDAAKKAALALGLRALKGPPRLGDNFFVKDEMPNFYAEISVDDFVKCSEKASDAEIAIARRSMDSGVNVGRSAAQYLGLEYLEKENLTNCLWYEGLRYAPKSKVKRAVAEWADGENIIRHIGYGIDIFCSRDMESTASILDANHRQWLSENYGVVFCSPFELAQKIMPRTK
jgi:hypothetical protein